MGFLGAYYTTTVIRRQLSFPVDDNYDCRLS